MNYILLKLINMSITASYLLFAVMILRLIFRKIPKYINCILWGIASLRLILPFSFESKLSLIPSSSPINRQVISGPQYAVDTGIEAVDQRVNHYIADKYFEGVSLPANYGETVSRILVFIWLIGIAILLIYSIISYIKLKRQVRISLPYEKNTLLCDSVSTPFILGIIKPKIYIPSFMEESERSFVLLHESAHIKRLDHIWKPLGFLILSIHWFNPIVWISYNLFCRDIEAACDQKVVAKMNGEDKKSYSKALLNCSAPKKLISACPLAFGETDVKKRIKEILKYKKPALRILIIAPAICVITAVCFLTDPISNTLADITSFSTKDGIEIVYDGAVHPIENQTTLDEAEKFFSDMKISFSPTSYSKSEARDSTYSIKMGNTIINISEDCDSVWINDGVKPSYSYDIKDPDKLLRNIRWLISESVYGPTISYFAATKDPVGAQFWLYTDTQTFRFIYSGYLSTVPEGTYEFDGDKLFLYDSSENNARYVFELKGDDYIFNEELSTPLNKLRFTENSEPETPLPDGTVFHQTDTLSTGIFNG